MEKTIKESYSEQVQILTQANINGYYNRRKRGRFLLRKEIGKKMSKSVDNCPGVWYYT